MGSSQSQTRKLTVENDDPTSVIKVSDDVVTRLRNGQEAPAPEVAPAQPFAYEPSITSLQLRQSHADQMRKNDQYWEARLKNLQTKHRQIDDVLDFEYKHAIEELEARPKNPYSAYDPPCQDVKNAVMKCYKQYPNRPMQCAALVQEFQDCVDSKRNCLVNNRG